VLDPKRILVGSRSNFGAPLITDGSQEGSFLSIDPSGRGILIVPPNFAASGVQTPPSGPVQMFSANSANWYNAQNNPGANTQFFTGVSNPLGLSNNNGFGRIWPANAPFGDNGIGSSTILDPNGRPLKGAPSSVIGGVYASDLTNRDKVVGQQQVIKGSLSTGAVGTAFLGTSPDGTCRAVFAVVTADGAIVQEHTAKGLDGIVGAGTVQPLLGRIWDPPGDEPRLGVLMNPYTTTQIGGSTVSTQFTAWQLFVSEPFNNTIAVVNLKVVGTSPNQVFGLDSITRISSSFLKLPVDLAPVKRDADSKTWASNTTLDTDPVTGGSDFYVANRGNNTIVRMGQDGSVKAIVRVTIDSLPLDNFTINGIATSTDGTKIYVTFTTPTTVQGGLLELPAFGG
jgi:hypothetical protein